MAGTGLYYVKKTPTKNDDTQSGVPVGQEITLVTGGLGVADAFKGGYVINVTRSETRSIVSHINDKVILEGVLTNWVDTDDLDIYDSWFTGSGGLAQLETDQGTSAFTSEQELRFHEGTYNETVALSIVLAPRPKHYLVIRGAADETVTVAGGAGVSFQFDSNARSWVRFENLTITSADDSALRAYSWLQGWIVKDCTLTAPNNAGIRCHASQRAQFVITGCTIYARYPILYVSLNLFVDCTIMQQGGNAAYGMRPNELSVIQGCTFIAAGNTCCFIALAGIGTRISNCTFEGAGYSDVSGIRSLASDDSCPIFSRNNIYHDLAAAYYENTNSLLYLDSDYNCFEGNTNIFESQDGTDYATLSAWQAATVLDLTHAEVNPDANSFEDDPLMTDPDSGDFSLQDGSPCIGAGIGAGVIYDVNGDPLDPYHPSIGAVRYRAPHANLAAKYSEEAEG